MQQPAQNMYVASSGAPQTANTTVRTQQHQQQQQQGVMGQPPQMTQVSSLYHSGPPPQAPPSQTGNPNAVRGGAGGVNASGRHVQHVQTHVTYQQPPPPPPMHQSVVMNTFAQFTPRANAYQTAQSAFSYGTPLQTGFYPNYYFPTLQQPPHTTHQPHPTQNTHGRGSVVSNGLVNAPNATSASAATAAVAAAAQAQLQLPAGTLLPGSVATAGSVITTTGAQINVSPIIGPLGVGVVGGLTSNIAANTQQASVPQPPTQQRLRKHALKIIDPNTNKNILEDLNLNKSSSLSSLSTTSIAATTSTTRTKDYEHFSNDLQDGGVVMLDAARHNLPPVYGSMDVDVSTLHHIPQQQQTTPIVSARSAAPSVEILPSPQKPRPKKILPIVAPNDESNDQINIQGILEKLTTTAEVLLTQTQPTSVAVATKTTTQITIARNTDVTVAKENQEAVKTTPNKTMLQQPISLPPTPQTQQEQHVEELKTKNLSEKEIENFVADIKVYDTEEQKPQDIVATETNIEQVNAKKINKNEINLQYDEKKTSHNENNEINNQTTESLTTTTIDETDRVSIATEATESRLMDETIEKNDAKIGDEFLLLITYNVGQWSPENPTGKKQYDREQLLLLREAKASREQPKHVKNIQILPQTANLMPQFAQRNNQQQHHHHHQQQQQQHGGKRVQSIGGTLNINNASVNNNNNNHIGYISKSSLSGRNSMKRDVIHVNLSLNQDVKLNETDNAWRPRILINNNAIASGSGSNVVIGTSAVNKNANTQSDLDEKSELIRRVRGILNKLTPEKFDTLVSEILGLKIDTPDKMQAVIELVFEKAIDEPNFSVSYARLCQRLIVEVMKSDEQFMELGTITNLSQFRSALIDKTEREFTQNVVQSAAKEQKLQPIVQKIKACKNDGERAELEALLEEEERKIRRRSGGTVRFIGELFKISMLTSKIINSCIDTLLNPVSEDRLECLCKLLTTVGAKFESSPAKTKDARQYNLDKQIVRMQAIALKTDKEGSKISSRVRFMLQDVIDLRKNGWLSKKQDAPKTMQQIEKETKNEQMSAQYLNYGNNSMHNSLSSQKRDSVGSGGSANRGFDVRGIYGGSHSQRGPADNDSLRRPHHHHSHHQQQQQQIMQQQHQQQHFNSSNSSSTGAGSNAGHHLNKNNSSSNNNGDDASWHVQTKSGRAVDTNKLGLLNQSLDLGNKKMGGASQFQWNTRPSSSSTATTTLSNSFAVLSSLTDNGSKFGDRNSGRNKGSYNKGSMERERYGMNSRSGSTQASRENSTTRGGNTGSQTGRNNNNVLGNLSPSSSNSATSTKSSSTSHSKYPVQQTIPPAIAAGRLANKVPSSSMLAVTAHSTNNFSTNVGLRGRILSPNPNSNVCQGIPSISPQAVFVEPTDNDLKQIKEVVSEMIENALNVEQINTSVVTCIEKLPDNHRCGVIYFILTDYLHLKEVNHMSRRLLALCIVYMINNNYLTQEHFRLAYENFCEIANDLIVDIPELWLYIFEFIGPLLFKKMLTIKYLWCNKLRTDAVPNLGKKFLKTLLMYCTREIGPAFTRRLWREQNIKWTDFMSESDVKLFVQSNKLEYVENDEIPPYIERDNSEKHIKHVVDRVEQLLKGDSNAEEINDYLNANIAEVDKHFIRRLVTTLCNVCVLYKDLAYKLDTHRFQKSCIPILQRYIDSNEDCELECLYAMQIFVHNYEHPRGLLSELFAELYYADVIPQDSFIKWRDSKDQSAGKGVAVKGLNPFFNHMLTGETSDDNDN